MSETVTLAAARAREAEGDFQAADAAYRALHNPAMPDPNLLISWSRLRRRIGDLQSAGAMLQDAGRAGGGPVVLVEMAGLLLDQGRVADAVPLLRQASQSGRGPALDYEVARCEAAQGRHEQAATIFRQLMKQDPRQAAPRLAYARCLVSLNRLTEAEAAYTALLNREPRHLQALTELAYLHGSQKRFGLALELYDRVEQLGVDIVNELSQVTLALMHVCDWKLRDALLNRLVARIEQPRPCIMEAYALLAGRDDPKLHRTMGERFASAISVLSAQRERPASRTVGPADRRLRIGYLCGDFSQHATSLLLAGVLEAHDREKFEITAYDYSAEDGSPIRARIKAAFEHWAAISTEGPVTAARRIAADGIDILIDLKGYTERTRTEIMALRPAPVQVNFLGYVGTQAGGWTDYVIADATVLPDSEYANWTEQPVLMPASYYPNDRSRPNPPADADRAAHLLPADGTVFACFNNPFKISPDIFAVWMDILREAPGSVLWLYEGNQFMAANLRGAAKNAGIDPARLVFAPAVTLEQHLARHGCADIFLDTLPYGAHTTGADALWAGVPMISCPGRSWASRVGASLLQAVGMPELIAADLATYTSLALALARDPARLASLRDRLLAARDTAPLFDAAAFARALEQAYTIMAERARAGVAPAVIDLRAS